MPKRVLVADDSLTIQRAFAMVLGGQDISLLTARSVEDALTTARSTRPDLVIADSAMGNGNGYDLCASLRGEPGLRGVPVFILASAHVPYDEARGQRVGATGSLLKPFESQSLIDQVTAALARATDGQPATAAAAPPAPPLSVPRPAPTMDRAPDRAPAIDRAPAKAPPPVHAHAAMASAAPLPAMARSDLTERADPRRADSRRVDDEDYGEFTIERSSGSGARVPESLRAAPAPAPARAPSPPPASASPGLRPSLIPGIRPGAPLPVRVPASVSPLPTAASTSGAAAGPSARYSGGRTIMGLPSVVSPGGAPGPISQPRTGAPPVSRPGPSPAAPSSPSSPAPSPGSYSMSAASAAAVSASVSQKMASISARGPEYEAIAKLSREVIEQVVWEIVPELAEVIIRQEVDRLANAKR